MRKLIVALVAVVLTGSCSFGRIPSLYLFPTDVDRAINVVYGKPNVLLYRGEDIPLQYSFLGDSAVLSVSTGNYEGSTIARFSIVDGEDGRIFGEGCLSVFKVGAHFEGTSSCVSEESSSDAHVLRVEYHSKKDLVSEHFVFDLKSGGTFVFLDGT